MSPDPIPPVAPRAIFPAALLLLVGMLALLPGCSEPELTAEPVAPVLVVGVDGLEWSVLRPLLAQGRCPNLRALMERGTFGRLGTMVPTLSPILWTTIATGKMPHHHGILGFLDENNRTYTSSRRSCRALWNIADMYGLSSQVVGWWTTWPVEPIRGVMVSGTSSGAMLDVNWKPTLIPDAERQVHPIEREAALIALAKEVGSEQAVLKLSREVFGELPRDEMGIVESKILLPETLWSLQADATFHALMCDVLRDGVADLNMVYFGSPDVAGHRFWRYWEPELYQWPDNAAVDEAIGKDVTRFEPFTEIDYTSVRDLVATPAGDERLAKVLPNIYEWFDAMLGELVEIVGEDVTVIVVSDHGMHAVSTESPTAKFVTGHHQDGAPGVLVAAGPGIARNGDVEAFLADGTLTIQGSLLNVTPTVLALLGIPPDESQATRGAHRPMLTEAVQERSRMTPVASHDEGFRAATDEALPAEMDDAFRDRFAGLGYLGDEGEAMESAVHGEVQLVNPEGFVPDTEFTVDDGVDASEGDDG